MISKYLAVFRITWEQGLVYRLNFLLWRVRSVLQLLLVYFIWWTVIESHQQVFGYSQSNILTYILVASVVRAIVLSSRVMDVAGHINQGDVVNFLNKPLNFIYFYFTRDISDKLLNITFVIFETAIIIILLKPQIIFQQNLPILFLFIFATALAIILYFSIGFVLGLSAFWIENAWGMYFLLFVFLEGLGGWLFPIDILPQNIADIILLTPFPYLIYFPSKLYLGSMASYEMIQGFGMLIFWVIIMWLIMIGVLRLGLRHYTAVGH